MPTVHIKQLHFSFFLETFPGQYVKLVLKYPLSSPIAMLQFYKGGSERISPVLKLLMAERITQSILSKVVRNLQSVERGPST